MKKQTLINLFSSLFLLTLMLGLAPSAFSQLSQISEYDVNGLKVIVKNRPGTPTVAAGLFLRGGVQNVTPKNAGIENLMLQTATEGSKNFPSQLLRTELSRTGSVISSGANYDYSGISMISTRQNFDRSWDIFTDIALNPSFLPADVKRIKEQLITSLRSRTDSPESYLEAEQEKVIYAKHPYANGTEGTIASVGAITPVDLAAYHKNMMQTSKLLLVIVGDFDADLLKKKITESFGKLPRGKYSPNPLPALDFSTSTLNTAQRTLETNYVKGVFAAPPVGSADYYAMRIAIAIVQQQVFQEVRVKRNLSYAPGADMNSYAANTGNISVSAVNANEAVRVMLDVIGDLKKNTVEDVTIKEMSSFFLTTYYLKQETNAAQTGELASYELTGGGWRNSQIFFDKMREVKPEDIRRVVSKYMTNIRFVVVGDPAKVDKKIFLPGVE